MAVAATPSPPVSLPLIPSLPHWTIPIPVVPSPPAPPPHPPHTICIKCSNVAAAAAVGGLLYLFYCLVGGEGRGLGWCLSTGSDSMWHLWFWRSTSTTTCKWHSSFVIGAWLPRIKLCLKCRVCERKAGGGRGAGRQEAEVVLGKSLSLARFPPPHHHSTAATRYLICNCFCHACHMALKSECKLPTATCETFSR